MNITLPPWVPVLQTRWQRARRAFDARLMNERRLIIIALVCVIWLMMDTIWVTPSYERLGAALKRQHTTETSRDTLKMQVGRRSAEIEAQQREARSELEHTRDRVKQGQQALKDVQAMLAPARDMRQVLQGLLAQQGQLRVKSMKTFSPVEVSLGTGGGPNESVQLFRHAMEISVEGSYHEMLAWLTSVENQPHRLLWDDLKLKSDDQARLTMTVTVHTLSPDRATLEIAP